MLLILPLTGFSNDLNKLTCHSTVYAPFVFQDNGDIKGIDIDVIKEIGRRLEIEINFVLKPWKRLEKEVEEGSVSCVAAYFRTEERIKYMDFTTVPLHITSYTLFTRRDNKRAFSTLKDLKGWKIGVNRGFKTTAEFEDAVSNGWIIKHEVNNEEQSLKMIQLNRLDAILTNYHVGLYNIKKINASKIIPLHPSIVDTPAYFVFSKKKNLAYLIPKFDEALLSIIQDGTYNKIFSKYLYPLQ